VYQAGKWMRVNRLSQKPVFRPVFSLWIGFEVWSCNDRVIPLGTIFPEDVILRLYSRITLQRPGRYNQHCPVPADTGNSRTTVGTKAFGEPLCIFQFVSVYILFSRQPLQLSGRGKYIGCVGRARCLSASRAMAEMKCSIRTGHGEPDFTTETAAVNFIVHPGSLYRTVRVNLVSILTVNI